MGHQNRKATKAEMARAWRVIKDAYPEYDPAFGCHGAYGGYRAPRDHTIAFRLRDARGKFRSNVIWLMPEWLAALTPEEVTRMVEASNGKSRR